MLSLLTHFTDGVWQPMTNHSSLQGMSEYHHGLQNGGQISHWAYIQTLIYLTSPHLSPRNLTVPQSTYEGGKVPSVLFSLCGEKGKQR